MSDPRSSRVSLPIPLFAAMSACYFGQGPRYGEKPQEPHPHPTEGIPPTTQLDPDPSEGPITGPGGPSTYIPKTVIPGGYARRKAIREGRLPPDGVKEPSSVTDSGTLPGDGETAGVRPAAGPSPLPSA